MPLKPRSLRLLVVGKGKYVKATDVDHIKAVRDYPELKYELSNLQALCHSCHSQKTNKADHYPRYTF